MSTEVMPELEAPGKGPPLLERLIMRYWVGPRISKKDSQEKNWKRFEKTNQRIIDLLRPLPVDQLHKRVLVPKLKGIEDSSRFWSAAETLEHIEIVGDAIGAALEILSRKEVPSVQVDIASYKPKGKYRESDPRPAFEAFSRRLILKLSPLHFTLDRPYYFHPWLGPLSSLQWQWLLSAHSEIHFNQLQHVLK